jgi:hypothetical protein
VNIRRLVPRVLWIVWLVACAAAPAAAQEFAGERLVYEFGWQNISAATATVAVDAMALDGKPGYRASIKLQGKSALDWMWHVRDVFYVESTVADLRCYRYRFEQREAAFHLDTEIRRDAAQNVLIGSRTRIKKDGRKALKGGVAPLHYYDPLSAILYLRRAPLTAGKTFTINVFDGKETYDLVYTVHGEERVAIKLGTFDTWKVQPQILRTSNRDKEAKSKKVRALYLWLDKNPPHRIVRIESDAFVGRIFAELVQKN